MVRLPQGKPNFKLLQNFGSADSHHIMFYAFDVLVHRGEDIMQRPLSKRRARSYAGTLEAHDAWY